MVLPWPILLAVGTLSVSIADQNRHATAQNLGPAVHLHHYSKGQTQKRAFAYTGFVLETLLIYVGCNKEAICCLADPLRYACLEQWRISMFSFQVNLL